MNNTVLTRSAGTMETGDNRVLAVLKKSANKQGLERLVERVRLGDAGIPVGAV